MEFLYQIVSIVIIDLVLSGDNAVVIGMAAHRLDPSQRKKAMLLGGSAAIVLRLLLTSIAAFLLTLQGIQLGGGMILLWIGFKLLKQEEESQEGIKVATTMREAVTTILIADFVMSLDNVLGVAGASHGSTELLVFGLILSMGVLMFMGNLVANLINKLWWLSYVGCGVIAWTGGLMIFEDKLIRDRVGTISGLATHVAAAAITAITLGLAHWYHRIRNGARRV